MTNDKLLRIYINDHLAASAGGHELARRCLKSNEGTSFAPLLQRLIEEIEGEREALRNFLDGVGGTEDKLKQGAAWGAEKAGRLKLNGQIRGYSPLSRLVELEGLKVGVIAKLSLWEALRTLAETDPRLDQPRLDQLIEQARRQTRELEEARLEAAKTAFRDPARVG